MDVYVVASHGALGDREELHRGDVTWRSDRGALHGKRLLQERIAVAKDAELHAIDSTEEGALAVLIDLDRAP
jgi:hypothetical protein